LNRNCGFAPKRNGRATEPGRPFRVA